MFVYYTHIKEFYLSVLVLRSSIKSLRLYHQEMLKDFSNRCISPVTCVKNEGDNTYTKITVIFFNSSKSTVLWRTGNVD